MTRQLNNACKFAIREAARYLIKSDRLRAGIGLVFLAPACLAVLAAVHVIKKASK